MCVLYVKCVCKESYNMDEEAAEMRALQAQLGQLGLSGREKEEQQRPKALEELTLEGVVKHIKKLKSSDNSKTR